ALKELEQAKLDMAAAMQKFGSAADDVLKTGNHAYEQMTKLLTEAQAFVSQASATITLGESEIAEAKYATGSKDKLLARTNTGMYGMPWYSVRPRSDLEKQAGVYKGSDSTGILVINHVQFADVAGNNVTK